MDVMWPVNVTQLGIYYILERGCYMQTAFHRRLAYLHDIKGVREFKKLQFQFNYSTD